MLPQVEDLGVGAWDPFWSDVPAQVVKDELNPGACKKEQNDVGVGRQARGEGNVAEQSVWRGKQRGAW